MRAQHPDKYNETHTHTDKRDGQATDLGPRTSLRTSKGVDAVRGAPVLEAKDAAGEGGLGDNNVDAGVRYDVFMILPPPFPARASPCIISIQ